MEASSRPRDIEAKEIDHRFLFHQADEHTGPLHGRVREVCGDAARNLGQLLPPGRDKALAITKLEEAMFWANAAVARNGARTEG